MSTVIQGDFPFEEIRKPDGNMFDTVQDALAAGYLENQIWSIATGDEGDVWVYGPSYHFINVLGYIATAQPHDGNTYYEETL